METKTITDDKGRELTVSYTVDLNENADGNKSRSVTIDKVEFANRDVTSFLKHETISKLNYDIIYID